MNNISRTREVKNTFSELDAYYAGLTDECPDVEKWNLGISEHH